MIKNILYKMHQWVVLMIYLALNRKKYCISIYSFHLNSWQENVVKREQLSTLDIIHLSNLNGICDLALLFEEGLWQKLDWKMSLDDSRRDGEMVDHFRAFDDAWSRLWSWRTWREFTCWWITLCGKHYNNEIPWLYDVIAHSLEHKLYNTTAPWQFTDSC